MLDFVREPSPVGAEFPIAEAIAQALGGVRLPGSIQLRCEAGGEPPIIVQGNQDQITRILTNLIQNAVQAMPAGGELEVNASRPEEGRVCVTVRDTGSGIPQENLDKIFEPLFSTKTRGMGLGLTIAQRYAGLNGGQLFVESKAGSGTSFRLMLTAASSSGSTSLQDAGSLPRDPTVPEPVLPGDILVVDDEPDLAQGVARLLKIHGHAVRIAENGRHALELLRARAPSLILSDIVMPEMNGIEMLCEMRRSGSPVPVIFMTGYTELQGEALEAGATAILRKPVAVESLFQEIRRFCR